MLKNSSKFIILIIILYFPIFPYSFAHADLLRISQLKKVMNISDPMRISFSNPNNHDEDPTLMKTKDGEFFLCWFSNINGKNNLFIKHSHDGNHWSSPTQVTSGNVDDCYPTLFQDSKGVFHLAWFRTSKIPPFPRNIIYNQSQDGLHWNTENEVVVTSGIINDWAPILLEDNNQQLLLYFAGKRHGDSSREIYLTKSSNNGQSWQKPIKPVGINDRIQHDDFPFVTKTDTGEYLMAFNRYKKSFSLSMFSPTMEIYFSKSSDGINWQEPVNVSRDDKNIDTLPFLFPDQKDNWFIGWTSSLTDKNGDIVALPLSKLDDKNSLMIIHDNPDHIDYSARVLPTMDPQEFLMVWVTADDKAMVIDSKIFKLND